MNLETNDRTIPKGTVKLSLRLQTVAGFVRQGSRIADVGTDHGYVPVYLAQTGRIRSAIAMDVGKGPLDGQGSTLRNMKRGPLERDAPLRPVSAMVLKNSRRKMRIR